MAAPVFATKEFTEQYVNERSSSSSSSRVIASLLDVNLQTVALNVLNWASGKSAVNTAPTGIIIKLIENDTYVPSNSSGTFEVLSSATVDRSITVTVGGIPVTSFAARNGPSIGEIITGLIANPQNGFIVTNPTGNIVKIENPDSSFSGTIIVDNGGSGATFSDPSVYEGGTIYRLTQNSVVINIEGQNILFKIKDLVYNKILSSPFTLLALDNTGNWALPVTIGTLNNFRIDIYIVGETID